MATGLDEKMGFDTAKRGEARMQRFKGPGLLEYRIGGDRKAFAIGQGGRNVSLRDITALDDAMRALQK
ncbi:MAG: hypothetical protein GWN00_00165, partial [Aliifodinibius sp.]|nr:hypothetical protein [Phycisphaerae bacterium]NIT54697.1 hypothetical protein [Fodinibius sp.]NIW97581.1 hypothetical protein [Phycisphaerae bacterium]NIY23281.1 hypothetical protein [Fodinibius sp.]